MESNKTARAVVLIDPVSSGRFLKEYVPQLDYKLIGIFTLSDEILKEAGKYIPYEEKVKLCDVVIFNDNFEEIFSELQKLPYHISAVIPASEPAVELADKLAEKLALRGNLEATSFMRRDKYAMRCAVRDYGLSQPDFAACYTKEDVISFVRTHKWPIVAKTPKGAGAHHVFICNNLQEIEVAFEQIIDKKNVFGEKTDFVLLENFISGTQYAVELFGDGENLEVISIWKMHLTQTKEGKSFFDRLDLIVSPDELENFSAIRNYAIEVGKAIGIKLGPCLVELRDEPNRGPWLIEVGARLSGIDMPLMIRKISNFDPFKSTLEVYLDNEFRVPSIQYFKNGCIVFCCVHQTGKVDKIQGLDDIEKLSSHYMNHLYVQEGETIPPSRDLATIPLYLYLLHENKNQLESDIALAKQKFQVTFLSEIT